MSEGIMKNNIEINSDDKWIILYALLKLTEHENFLALKKFLRVNEQVLIDHIEDLVGKLNDIGE